MLIVDAQIHLWSQGIPTNALHRQIPSYPAEECLMEMDTGGVQAALIHPPGWDPNRLVVAESAEVAALAKFPNVALKATGAAGESSEPYPFRNIHKYIKQLYDAFGPQRFFWGTDITRMPCSWLQCVTLFTEELPWLKGQDLELVM